MLLLSQLKDTFNIPYYLILCVEWGWLPLQVLRFRKTYMGIVS